MAVPRIATCATIRPPMPIPALRVVNPSPSSAVRPFAASVAYRDVAGKGQEEHFPVVAADPRAANHLALAYVLQILRLDDFELRVVGA
jgi:hypothetical protein